MRLTDGGGRVLAAAEGGSANVYLALDASLAGIEDTLRRATAEAGLDDGAWQDAALGLGLAGVSSDGIAARVAAAFAPRFAHVVVRNDAVIACLGAHAGQDGGLVIAGTGSAATLRLTGADIAIGGRGFLLGDDGSGAVMGRQIWRRALRAHDGLEPASPLLRSLMAEFDHDPVAVITWGRHATSRDFGSYAPRILTAAHDGDPAAAAVVGDASQAIGELVDALVRRDAPRVSLVGGLAAPLQPFLADATRARLEPPLGDALDGALVLAGLEREARPRSAPTTAPPL